MAAILEPSERRSCRSSHRFRKGAGGAIGDIPLQAGADVSARAFTRREFFRPQLPPEDHFDALIAHALDLASLLGATRVCNGKPVVKGTRIPVAVVLEHMASGEVWESILADFPELRREDIEAVLRYAKHAVVNLDLFSEAS